MTNEEIKRIYNLRWLSSKVVDPTNEWIRLLDEPMSAEEIQFREVVHLYCDDPWNNDDDRVLPLAASSWSDCAADGLVQMGWINLGSYGRERWELKWSIRLTKRGRQELSRTHYQ